MMKTIYLGLVYFLLATNSCGLSAQNLPELSGTWYSNGLANAIATITQNGNQLSFSYNGSYSSGYFSGPNQVYAIEWKTIATIENNGQSIKWDNQVWTRNISQQKYPDISGTWYANGDPSAACQISQSDFNLHITFQGRNYEGYYYEANKIYVKEWNASAEVSTDLKTISWSNQNWTRGSTGSSTTNIPRASHRYCRFELSSFYYASQLLGSVWGRSATEPTMPTAEAIIAMRTHLISVIGTLTDNNYSNFDNCLQYDVAKLRSLHANLPSMSSAQIAKSVEEIIKDIESSVSTAPFQCDNGVNPISLYIAGIHLGAAQAWASAQQCMPAPMPAVIASVISNHLTTASNALTPYASCLNAEKSDGTLIPAFNFSNFTNVPLASLNSIAAHTAIVGTETQLLWAIALSPCCCNCTGNNNTNAGSPCDNNCAEYCKQKGYQNGKYNGKAPCLLGVVHEGGCDCH